MQDIFTKARDTIEKSKHHLIQLDNIAGPREGAFDIHSPTIGAFVEVLHYIDSLILKKPIKILQIGFNAGHSTVLLNSCFINSDICSVDIGEHQYSEHCNNYILDNLEIKHNLILENSITALSKIDDKFDLIFIDGGHVHDVPYFDIFQCQKLATKDTWVIMDDVCNMFYGSEPSSAWEWNKGIGKIKEYGRWMSENRDHGFAYGKFTFEEKPQDVHVIIAHYNEDISWTKNLVYPYTIISRSNLPKEIPPNKGNEAASYLEWIIENYDNLPDTMVFVHGHRNSWHNKFPPIDIYINNCSYIRAYKNINDEALWLLSSFSGTPELYQKYVSVIENTIKQKIYLDKILYRCCSQFYIKKHIILQYTKNDYIKLYDWLMNNEPSEETSRIFEYTFHIMFTGIHGDSG